MWTNPGGGNTGAGPPVFSPALPAVVGLLRPLPFRRIGRPYKTRPDAAKAPPVFATRRPRRRVAALSLTRGRDTLP